MGIEPTSEAWEASILPLYDARSIRYSDIIPKNVSHGIGAVLLAFEEHTLLKNARPPSQALACVEKVRTRIQ